MRVLAVADIHGNHAVYQWLASLVVPTSAELVLLAGDLSGFYDGFDSIEEAQRAEARDIHWSRHRGQAAARPHPRTHPSLLRARRSSFQRRRSSGLSLHADRFEDHEARGVGEWLTARTSRVPYGGM